MEENLVKHAYEQTVTYASRLSSYASSDLPISEEIEIKQDLLALEDLIHFAYHTRRLLSLSETEKLFSYRCIPIEIKTGKSIQFKKVLDTIIHNDYIDVIRTKIGEDLENIKGKANEKDLAIDLLIQYKNNKKITPVKIVVKSDLREPFIFLLKDLVNCFEKHIIEIIIDNCAKKHIYLGSFFD